ncbi:MAG: hypothetical protein K8R23_13060 [Chthoniobacter sp.]|nr:hypothetical protein [Chthoniobacter sp.]
MSAIRPTLALAVLCALGGLTRGADLPLTAALARSALQATWTGNGRDQLSLAITNTSATPASVAIPAGLIAADHAGGNRLIVLRAAQLTIPAGTTAEVALPAAALSAKNAPAAQRYRATADTEPRLGALLKFLADKPDIPRPTAQLTALAFVEDVTFAQWQLFLAPRRADEPPDPTRPTPLEVTQAIDALGLLRTLAPEKTFALATDAELKLRALRNPWCRTKAVQLYGITLPTSDGAVPPDLGQLLHLKPGDNCPICRQRAEMLTPASDF